MLCNVQSSDIIQDAIVVMLGNVEGFGEYNMMFYPYTEKIVRAMDNNKNNEIETLSLWINRSNSEMQFNNVISSPKQKETIQDLRVYDTVTRPRADNLYNTLFLNSLEQLKNLKNLKIDSNINCGHNYTLIIDILQKLPKLQALYIQKYTADSIAEEITIDKKSSRLI